MSKNIFYAQSGGVTPVINASAAGVIQQAAKYPERINKVYAGEDGILTAEEVASLNPRNSMLENEYKRYYVAAQTEYEIVPNLKGMSGMDAVALLENLGIEVEVIGNGKVKRQSVAHGTSLTRVKRIVLELS